MKSIDKNKIAIFLFSILGVLATDSFAPLIQKVGQSYPDVSEPVVKQLITLPSTISMVVGLIAGQLVRVVKKRKIIIAGLALYSIGGIVGAFWIPSFGVHMAIRALLGAGIGLVSPISLSLIGDYYVGDERAGMIGNSLAFSKIFAIMVPPVAAVLAAKSWQNVYFLYFISVGILIYTIFALDSSGRNGDAAETKRPAGKIPPITFFMALSQFVLLAIFFILVTDLSYLIEVKNSQSTVMSGFGLSVTTLGTTIAGLVFKKLHKVLKKWVVPGAFIVMGAGFLIVTHSVQTGWVLLGLSFAGFGVGLVISMINLTTTNAVGDFDSTASVSIVNCASSFGVFVSPFLYGWNPVHFPNMTRVESNFQTAGILYLMLGLLSLIFIVYQLVRNLKSNKRQETLQLEEE